MSKTILVRTGSIYKDGTSSDFNLIDGKTNAVMFKGTMDREGDTYSIADADTGKIVSTGQSWADCEDRADQVI